MTSTARPETARPLPVALWLAGQGIHVHPLIPGRKIPPRGCDRCWRGTKDQPNPTYVDHTADDCDCLRAGRYCHGVLAATTDPTVITGWYNEMPAAGVGINAGKSHLLILDVDRHNVDRPTADRILPGVDLPDDIALESIRDGEDVLALLCEIRGVMAPTIDNPTMTIRTPSGGLQLWWRVTPGQEWTPSAGKLGWQLDVRAGRSYGIAPGTVTPTGSYAAYGPCRTIAPLPTWLAADLKRTGHYVEPKPPRRRVKASHLLAGMTPKGDRYVTAAVEAEITELASTTEGGRNQATFNAARALGRFIPTGQLTEREVEDMVVGAAQAAGLSEQEARAAVRSGIRTRTARGVSA